MKHLNAKTGRKVGFTLVELLVVIGIISLLISMLLPALHRVKAQAMSTKCKASLRDLGMQLYIYSEENRGVIYPIGELINPTSADPTWQTLGYELNQPDLGRGRRWPAVLYKVEDEYTKGTYDKTKPIKELKVINPDYVKCPMDQDPTEDHTFILNKHLAKNFSKAVKLGRDVLDSAGNRKPSSDVLLAGEKKIGEPDYYMELKQGETISEFSRVVEPYKHGIKLGSNYLYLDRHVDIVPPQAAIDAMDSWDAMGNVDTNASTQDQTNGNPVAPAAP